MGRFIERYKKHPERGRDYYLNQISSYAASLVLGRGFHESMDHYLTRCPNIAASYSECTEDRAALNRVPA